MADAPPEPGVLFSGHTSPAFFECGDWEGVWERQRGARSGFEEELMGDATVLILVASSLSNALYSIALAY